jgi:hypothetical protein
MRDVGCQPWRRRESQSRQSSEHDFRSLVAVVEEIFYPELKRMCVRKITKVSRPDDKGRALSAGGEFVGGHSRYLTSRTTKCEAATKQLSETDQPPFVPRQLLSMGNPAALSKRLRTREANTQIAASGYGNTMTG